MKAYEGKKVVVTLNTGIVANASRKDITSNVISGVLNYISPYFDEHCGEMEIDVEDVGRVIVGTENVLSVLAVR